MKAVGSQPLGARVAALQPDLHVFGHTHFGWVKPPSSLLRRSPPSAIALLLAPTLRHPPLLWWQDATIDGVRYVQAPLATPAERSRRMPSLKIGEEAVLPLKLYDGDADSGRGGYVGRLRAAWSDHYDTTRRTPTDTYPAPWVLNYYTKRAPARVSLAPGGFGVSAATTPRGVGYVPGGSRRPKRS